MTRITRLIKIKILFFFLLFLPLSLSIQAQSEPESSLVSELLPITRVKLENGITVLVKENYANEGVAMYLMIKVGQPSENVRTCGITNFLQNLLLKRKKIDVLTLSIESRGGIIDAKVTPDVALINITLPARYYKEGIRTLFAIIDNPQFDPQITETIRKEIISQIRKKGCSSYTTLYNIFLQQFYSFHPYRFSEIGTESSIKNISLRELKEHFDNYYTPNNMIISVVGNVDRNEVVKEVKKCFGKFKKRAYFPSSSYYEPQLSENREFFFYGGEISWLFLGFSAPDVKSKDFLAMQIINSLLGENMSSRIWLELREKRGLAYQLGSVFPARKGPSHFIVYVATDSKAYSECRRLIFKEIKALKEAPIDEDELKRIKQMMIGKFILSLETNKSQAYIMGWAEALGLGYLYEKEYIQRIERISPKEIQEVARRYLNNYILLVAK